MTKRNREGEEKGPLEKIGKICYFDVVTADLWKEVAQWLLNESYGKSALLPLMCKGWNMLYKSCELWRFLECLKSRRGCNLIKAAFCKRLCESGYFASFLGLGENNWIMYSFFLYLNINYKSYIKCLFRDSDVRFSLLHHHYRITGSGEITGLDFSTGCVHPEEDSFLRTLVCWEGEIDCGTIVENFHEILSKNKDISGKLFSFLKNGKIRVKCW